MPEGGTPSAANGRVWPPFITLLVIAVGTFVLYNTSPPAVANVAAIPYAISLACGPLLVYPWLRRRRISARKATAAALGVPVLWLVKECYNAGTVFGFRETIYYAFNPIALGLFAWAALQLAAAEIVIQRLETGRWRFASGAGAVLLVVALLGALYIPIARRHGVTAIFYAYIALYRYLFGG